MSSSLVFVVIVGLWVVVLVPYWLRRREQMSGSRHTDRYSEQLRVLPRRLHRRPEGSPDVGTGRRLLASPASSAQGRTPSAGRVPAQGGTAGDTCGAAGATPSRPLRRRGRRRGVAALLLLVLLASLVAVVIATPAGLLPSWAPAVPAGLLLMSVAALRARVRASRRARAARTPRASRAARASRAGDRAGASPARAAAATQGGTGGPALTPEAPGSRDDDGHVAASATPRPAAVRSQPTAGPTTPAAEPPAPPAPGSWTPVPVPRPTYTLKPQAPRRPVPPVDGQASTAGATGSDAAPERSSAAGDAPGLLRDLDAVLARRRAV